MASAFTVRSLWRYPVKSMGGEACSRLAFAARGAEGDRAFAVRAEDGRFGSGKSTRRFVRIDGLFRFRAVYDAEVPVVLFPDGRVVRGDDPAVDGELSKAVGRDVTLAREGEISHFDDAPVHLVTTSALAWLHERLPDSVVDERRFRPNILVRTDGREPVEREWIGRRVRVGREVALEITHATERCVMTSLAQPGLPEDPRVFALVGREAGLRFGVYARVLAGGVVSCGDRVELS